VNAWRTLKKDRAGHLVNQLASLDRDPGTPTLLPWQLGFEKGEVHREDAGEFCEWLKSDNSCV